MTRKAIRVCALLIASIVTTAGLSRAEAGDFTSGVDAFNAQQYAVAFQFWLHGAQAGDPLAQHSLGDLYAEGMGAPKSMADAIRWWKAAAEQGNGDARSSLWTVYSIGEGVPQNFAEAVKWQRLGADKGDPYAQSALAAMYERGEGVPKDLVIAHLWYNLAAAQLGPDGPEAKGRDRVASMMTADQISEAQKLAEAWRPN